MKVTTRTALAVALAVGSVSAVFGQQQKAHDEMSGPDTKDSVEAEMRIADANQDAKISAREHEARAKQMFQEMDRNADQRVTPAEMDATPNPMQSREAGRGHQMSDSHQIPSVERIKSMDTDRDGALSADECAAASKKTFAKMDSNHDGFLTAAEIKSGHESTVKAEEKAQL